MNDSLFRSAKYDLNCANSSGVQVSSLYFLSSDFKIRKHAF